MDKAAVGFDYKSQAEKHDSQKGELGGGGNAAGSVRTGAWDYAHWGCGALCLGFCNLLHEWWKSCGELLGAHCLQQRNGSGEESHCTMHDCWRKFRLNEEEQQISMGTGISWAHGTKGRVQGKPRQVLIAGGLSQGGGRAIAAATSGEI